MTFLCVLWVKVRVNFLPVLAKITSPSSFTADFLKRFSALNYRAFCKLGFLFFLFILMNIYLYLSFLLQRFQYVRIVFT